MSGKNTVVVYASAARTATPTAVTRRVDRYRGCVLNVDVTAATATPSVVVTIDGVNAAGNTYNILTSAAFTESGAPYRRALRIYPGIAAAANVSVADVLPQSIKITFTHGDTDSITYSADLVLIP